MQGIPQPSSPHARTVPCPVGSYRVMDGFWSPRLKRLLTHTLMQQYQMTCRVLLCASHLAGIQTVIWMGEI